MNIETTSMSAVHKNVTLRVLDGEPVLRVVKKDKLMKFDKNTYVKITDSSFYNGEIEVKMLSRLLPDAPDLDRGFIGIAFRINEENTKFESFYLRHQNGRTADPIRKNPAVLYFSYPHYTFNFFRTNGITDFEGPAHIGLNEWITLKAVVKDGKGAIGLFVDAGTEAFFKDLKITTAA